MAGILDEIMDGLNAKETPAAETETKEETAPQEKTPQASAEKGLHEYSDQFKEKYGERK